MREMSFSTGKRMTLVAFIHCGMDTMSCIHSECSGSGQFLKVTGNSMERFICKICQAKWWCCSLCIGGRNSQIVSIQQYSMDYRYSIHAKTQRHLKQRPHLSRSLASSWCPPMMPRFSPIRAEVTWAQRTKGPYAAGPIFHLWTASLLK